MPPAQLGWLLSQYAGEIRWTDEHLGRFFALLESAGLWDDALVIVTADHGEEFFDHGAKGHKNNLHAETVHVPLMIKFPGQHEGRREARLVSLVDIVPTVLELAGVALDFPVEGRSLLASEEPRPVLYDLLSVFFFRQPDGALSSRATRHHGIREGPTKLLWNDGGGGGLYDVVQDPGERVDLGDRAGERRDALRRSHAASTARSREIAGRYRRCGEAQLTEEEIEQLRELGYLGR
jgi:arylsulfatase A-like enzyme